MSPINRRNFIKTTFLAGAAGMYSYGTGAFPFAEEPAEKLSYVSLTTGGSRADMAFRALEPFSKQVKRAIGNKRVILKPNNVVVNKPLACTHLETLEGVLEFLKSIGKKEDILIAESAATGPTFDAYENFGYMNLLSKYPVKLVDLDQEPYEMVYVISQKDFRPHPVRVSSMLLNQDSYIISAARMKTHDRVVATLSLKNIVLAAPLKLPRGQGKDLKQPYTNDKPLVHGDGFYGINYNLFALSSRLHPHLALIDGFEGMEGNGPGDGTPVDHRICVAGTDWLAVDRVGIELMGIDFSDVGYLNYCADAGLGVADLEKIGIIGEKVADHKKSYKLSDNINSQMAWKSLIR
jgi:uncharacterized protein (DUF362 family)